MHVIDSSLFSVPPVNPSSLPEIMDTLRSRAASAREQTFYHPHFPQVKIIRDVCILTILFLHSIILTSANKGNHPLLIVLVHSGSRLLNSSGRPVVLRYMNSAIPQPGIPFTSNVHILSTILASHSQPM